MKVKEPLINASFVVGEVIGIITGVTLLWVKFGWMVAVAVFCLAYYLKPSSEEY